MAESRLPQVSVEVSREVAQKLDKLEADLRAEKIVKHEIVAVLILRATAKSISARTLKEYRQQREKAAAKLRKQS